MLVLNKDGVFYFYNLPNVEVKLEKLMYLSIT